MLQLQETGISEDDLNMNTYDGISHNFHEQTKLLPANEGRFRHKLFLILRTFVKLKYFFCN